MIFRTGVASIRRATAKQVRELQFELQFVPKSNIFPPVELPFLAG
jgi:hypothetical protein